MARVRILLVVHSPSLLSALELLVAGDEQLDLVATASSSNGALTEASRVAADVAVVDMSLPDGAGLLAAQCIRLRWPATKVVMLSDEDHEEYQRAAREVGASGCVPKALAGPLLTPTIMQVAR